MNPELLGWLQVLNVLLVPLLIQGVKLAGRLQKIESSIEAHIELDDEQHATIRRDVERADAAAAAAHRRLDASGVKPASAQ